MDEIIDKLIEMTNDKRLVWYDVYESEYCVIHNGVYIYFDFGDLIIGGIPFNSRYYPHVTDLYNVVVEHMPKCEPCETVNEIIDTVLKW